MKLKHKMSSKILSAIKKCLLLVVIWLSGNTMIIQTNYLFEKSVGTEEFFGAKI